MGRAHHPWPLARVRRTRPARGSRAVGPARSPAGHVVDDPCARDRVCVGRSILPRIVAHPAALAERARGLRPGCPAGVARDGASALVHRRHRADPRAGSVDEHGRIRRVQSRVVSADSRHRQSRRARDGLLSAGWPAVHLLFRDARRARGVPVRRHVRRAGLVERVRASGGLPNRCRRGAGRGRSRH